MEVSLAEDNYCPHWLQYALTLVMQLGQLHVSMQEMEDAMVKCRIGLRI